MASEADMASVGLAHFHEEVDIARGLFEGGHFQEAVRKAAERFLNRVAELARRNDLVGAGLVNRTFSENQPILEFDADRSSLQAKNRHDGFRFLSLGLTLAVRNIYSHADDLPVTEIEALEWLGFLSAMHRRLDRVQQVAAYKEVNSEPTDSSEPENIATE